MIILIKKNLKLNQKKIKFKLVYLYYKFTPDKKKQFFIYIK